MISRFDFYDIFTVVIPGGVSIMAIRYLFPDVAHFLKVQDKIILSFVFLFFSLIAGHLLHAVKSSNVWKSLVEGESRNPSDHVFANGLSRFVLSKEYSNLLKDKLLNYKKVSSNVGFSDSDIFNFALQLSSLSPTEKMLKLYGQYEFYRVMNVSIIFILALYIVRLIILFSYNDLLIFNVLFVFLAVCFLLFRNMARSRARYWVREVLFIAEAQIDADSK